MQIKTIVVFIATIAVNTVMAQTQAPSFPGAEGNGRYTTGGRGGKIIHVTNLNDGGTGSFRAAVSGNTPKTIVFDVAGVIPLQRDLTIGANTTILGQTAPYPGITLRYYTVRPSSNNVIRFIRIRRGQEKDKNDGADAIWNRELTNVILDHCSFSWSIDEVASFYDNNNFTMQWCTVGESLNNAGHSKKVHGYGGIWGGKLASFHHNMIAHVNNRAPRFNGARYDWTGYTQNTEYDKYQWENSLQAENVDFRNCLIFDWGGGGCYGGPGGGYINMVNNYYKATPETSKKNRVTLVSIADSTTSSDNDKYMGMTSRYYINGNYVHGYGANYDWQGVAYDSGIQLINGERYTLDPSHYYGTAIEHVDNAAGKPCVKIKLDQPMAPAGTVTTHRAETAYEKILDYCGASFFRDDVDARYMREARNGISTYAGSVTKTKGRIDRVADVEGYTENDFPQSQREDGYDTDKDGIPDAWEIANGLDPNNPNDANSYSLDPKGYYTNIEVYANSLVEEIMKGGNADAESPVAEYYPTVNKVDGIEYYTGRIVERLTEDTPDDPTTGEHGAITWRFDTGIDGQATYAAGVANAITSSAVTLGDNLSIPNTRTLNDIVFSLLQPATKQPAPTTTDAVTFSFTVKEGYSFQPSKLLFVASRIGTDGGFIDVVYSAGKVFRTVVTGLNPNRNNNAVMPYSQVSESISGIPTSSGTHNIAFNIYQLGETKQVGLANIIIEGTLTSPSGIRQKMTVGNHKDTATYNLSGQRVDSSYKGIVIRNGRKNIQK